ncbi:MAG: carbamoyltransferase HypF [Gemmatimonadota bacterium]|nr:MAG: carbamoyltransferase HypF [Gemmatimonadota bacterium]
MNKPAREARRQALRISVTGVVQGVGFRPFVHRLALEHRVNGWIRNESGEVRIVIEGASVALEALLHDLTARAPPLARIDGLDVAETTPEDVHDFRIVGSSERPYRRQPVSPDVALCQRCEVELSSPGNRRFRYPFVTCTDCGPRYTVMESMPYDRERTSMRVFSQCRECLKEYRTPEDRRYHSETNSCPGCGPRLWLEKVDQDEAAAEEKDAIRAAADLLREGQVLALRGLGGFHLAVDATNEDAVQQLRSGKHREARPLAIMVQTVARAGELACVGIDEGRLLASRESPIVLLDVKPESRLAPSVAPGLDTVGVMTAYTPLHYLLLEHVDRPLVMTSGNPSGQPIAIANDDARQQLSETADAFLMHDREIVARCDDSVVRMIDGAPVFLRRARGYAPLPVDLPIPTPVPLVAVGPHLKNTFTLAQDGSAYVSQHIGDLENLETLRHFRATLGAYSRLFRIEPEVAVRDTHPGYLSTRIAHELGLDTVLAVQHHHAHIAAVAAECGVTDRVIIGVAFDGAGYGDDGNVWGAEILLADLTACERVCQLRYAPLPGGDLAARQPWRVALGYRSLDPTLGHALEYAFAGVDATELSAAEQQLESALNTPLTSSMGRLFDAAAAVLGTRRVSRYEGQAAMELEALAGRRVAEPLPFPIVNGERGTWMMDPLPLLAALGERRMAGDDVADLAARFHESLGRSTVSAVERVREESGILTVGLGGGVFQNRRLLTSVSNGLREAGFHVLVPRCLSPNDGAISYGQAAVAAALLQGGSVGSHRQACSRRQYVSRHSWTPGGEK